MRHQQTIESLRCQAPVKPVVVTTVVKPKPVESREV
jgi:hypothetical protein